MKKFYLYILFFISSYLSYAQVGINTDNPDLSAMLQVVSASKGVSFPNVHLQSLTDKTTITNPKESLLVFNTNDSLRPGAGLYYWSGDKWVVIISDKSKFLFENLLKFYAKKDNTGYDFVYDNFHGENTTDSSVGNPLSGQWNVINELTSDIVIDRPENDELYTITGMMQANNTANNTSYVSTSIGVFIDDKLVAIRPIFMGFDSKCTYREFTVSFFSKNLEVGNHRVKFAIRNRRANGNRQIILSFGKRNPEGRCNNMLSNDEMRMSSNIFINQPFDF